MSSAKINAAKVPRRKAERLRRKLLAIGALDLRYKPVELDGYVYFPLKRLDGKVSDVLSEEGAVTAKIRLEERVKKPRSLREALKGKIPGELIDKVPSSYDLIGDLIWIEIPEELREFSRAIGEALLELHPRVRSVLAKGKTVGTYRVREVEVIAGTGETETVHREHGCVYKLDLRKTFFNPRFSGERLRVARSVKPGERVLDMFAGIGAFSILIAKLNPSCRVLAVELNPDAYRYLVENIRLNRVENRVTAVHGDAGEIARSMKEKFDRVIMDLPRSSLSFLDSGLEACRKGGLINFYISEESVRSASEKVLKTAGELGFEVEVEYAREVMETAPRRFTIALDLRRLA
ncbi:MAG: class I SAM-dependent methyltransferase family protein [Thaumarchaeota archaeon]|nr:class I SAM-dependent methyltransferase family protein [Nitrososphaerota archaeon]